MAPTAITAVISDSEVESVMEHFRNRPPVQRVTEILDVSDDDAGVSQPQSSAQLVTYDSKALARTDGETTVVKPSDFVPFAFNCQLAHGSGTVSISEFRSIGDLFSKIASAFQMSSDDIIFCTINTFKPNMDKLFAGTVDTTDMLFVHTRGQTVEVEVTKTEEALGVTIADNGLCRSFIKRIRPDSIVGKAGPALAVGQLIERVNGVNLLGMRHYEVARFLRHIPIGNTFTMRLVSPMESGFSFVQARQKPASKMSVGNGSQTIRFKATGGVVVQEDVPDKVVLSKLNDIFDTYLGVQDDELAMSVWDTATKCGTFAEMSKAIRESELNVFGFDEELIFDMWGVVGDWKRTKDSGNVEGRDDETKEYNSVDSGMN